jgi:hypothetical protein
LVQCKTPIKIEGTVAKTMIATNAMKKIRRLRLPRNQERAEPGHPGRQGDRFLH